MYYILSKTLSWQRIEKALPYHREGGTRRDDRPRYACGLAGGPVYGRLFLHYEEGKGNSYVRICKHSNGICIGGALNVDVDDALAKKIFNTLKRLN